MGAYDFPAIPWLSVDEWVYANHGPYGQMKVKAIHNDKHGVYYEFKALNGESLYLSLRYAHQLRPL